MSAIQVTKIKKATFIALFCTSILLNVSAIQLGWFAASVSGNMAEWATALATFSAIAIAFVALSHDRELQSDQQQRDAASQLAFRSLELLATARTQAESLRTAKVQLGLAGAARLKGMNIEVSLGALSDGPVTDALVRAVEIALLESISEGPEFRTKPLAIPRVQTPLFGGGATQ